LFSISSFKPNLWYFFNLILILLISIFLFLILL
jgi:hypothetical protein